VGIISQPQNRKEELQRPMPTMSAAMQAKLPGGGDYLPEIFAKSGAKKSPFRP